MVGSLMVQVILGTVYGFSVIVKPLELEFGWERATTQWAFSVALATFAVAMIPAGRLQDRIGPRKVAMIGGVLLGLSFLLRALLVTADLPWALYLTHGLNFGGNFALFPSATSDYFGTRHFGINYGWIFTAYGVAGILGPVVGGVMFDATGQYILAFLFAGILCFLAAACSVVIWALARRPIDED